MLKTFRKRVRLLKGNEQGFTLVELLLVITIIGVLAGVGVTGYRNFQERAYKAAADAAWRDLQVAINLYEAEKGEFPSSDGSDETVKAIESQLNPPPEPLKTDLSQAYGGAPPTSNGRINPSGSADTGFFVRGAGNSRISCVWVNTHPSRFNPPACNDVTDSSSDDS